MDFKGKKNINNELCEIRDNSRRHEEQDKRNLLLLGRNFQHGWNGGVVILQYMPNVIGNVLVD